MLTRLKIQCIYRRKGILADLVQGETNIPHLVTLIPTQARETNLIAWQRKSPNPLEQETTESRTHYHHPYGEVSSKSRVEICRDRHDDSRNVHTLSV